jgi:hypothetical protein
MTNSEELRRAMYRGDNEVTLKCGECDSENIHQHRVEVFSRYEDEEKYPVYIINHGPKSNPFGEDSKEQLGLSLKQNCVASKTRNPSERRNGVNIIFWCELCDHKTKVSIAQHKGMEHMRIG